MFIGTLPLLETGEVTMVIDILPLLDKGVVMVIDIFPLLEKGSGDIGKGRGGHDHQPTHFLGKEWAIVFIDTLPLLEKREVTMAIDTFPLLDKGVVMVIDIFPLLDKGVVMVIGIFIFPSKKEGVARRKGLSLWPVGTTSPRSGRLARAPGP